MSYKCISSIIILLAALGVVAQMPITATRKKHPMHIQLSGLNQTNSDGVNRLSIKLVGPSHSSSRVDSAKIFMADGLIYAATDIDGIDFNRYFQWEDGGVQSIEIDFPMVADYSSADTLIFYTVHGEYKTSLKSFKE